MKKSVRSRIKFCNCGQKKLSNLSVCVANPVVITCLSQNKEGVNCATHPGVGLPPN